MLGNPLLLGDDGYNISRSVRFRSSATAWLTRPFATPTNSSKWTMSMWVKRGSLGTLQGLFGKTVSVSANFYLAFNTDSTIAWTFTNSASMTTSQVFRDPSAWYHVMAVWDSANATANLRARLYINGAEISAFSSDGRSSITTGADAWNTTSTAYMHAVGAISATSSTVSNNLDGYLTEINFIDGQALTPSSFGQNDPVTGVWGAKKYAGTYGTNGFYLNFSDNSAATAAAIGKDSSGNGNNWTPNNISLLTATVPFNYISGSDSANGFGMFGNSSLPVGGANASHFPKSNGTYTLNRTLTAATKIEAYCYIDGVNSGTIQANGGSAKTLPASTTPWSWVKVDLGVTSLSSITLANSNWTGSDPWIGCLIVDNVVVYGTAAIAAAYDSMIDVPTIGGAGSNYCTLNPLTYRFLVGQGVYSDGNSKFTYSGSSSAFALGTIGVSSGKWYFEATLTAVGSFTPSVGIADIQCQWGTFTNLIEYSSNGTHYPSGSWATFTTNDVIGVAFDLDGSTISFYKNNSLQGSVSIPSGVTYHGLADSVGNSVWAMNFGQQPFAYTPPTGFKALNTQNLPDATIKAGNKYFDATLYTGNGTSQNVLNAAGFQPDLFWAKKRSAIGSHAMFDSVRGANQGVYPDLTAAEGTWSGQAFLSNGFTVNATYSGETNGNGITIVGWQWKKGATQGFDVVTFSATGVAGQTVAHSLGVAPAMIIIKNRISTTENWTVYHKDLGPTKYLSLNLTAIANTSASPWNNTAPSSSVVTLGNGYVSGNSHVMYAFSEVAGFSKFGSYTGNGSADGPFVYCGFRPRFLLVKRSDGLSDWYMVDTSRDTYNLATKSLFSDLSDAEGTIYATFDILSNGFKLRGSTTNNMNGSGATYIFAAFAENPFKNSLAR